MDEWRQRGTGASWVLLGLLELLFNSSLPVGKSR